MRKVGMKAEGAKAEAEARRRALVISFILDIKLCVLCEPMQFLMVFFKLYVACIFPEHVLPLASCQAKQVTKVDVRIYFGSGHVIKSEVRSYVNACEGPLFV